MSLRSRMANTEIQFAFMLVDICRMELASGDLPKAERALVDARAIGEVIAAGVQTRGGVRTTVRTNILKLASEIDLAQQMLLEVRKVIAADETREQMENSPLPQCVPAEVPRAATAGW